MLKNDKAIVVTSKFLQLKAELDRELQNNKINFAPGLGNSFQDYTQQADIRTLVNKFGELCELLHELVITDENNHENI